MREPKPSKERTGGFSSGTASSWALDRDRGGDESIHLAIELTSDLIDPLVAKLAELGRRLVVLHTRLPGIVLVDERPERRVQPCAQPAPRHPIASSLARN